MRQVRRGGTGLARGLVLATLLGVTGLGGARATTTGHAVPQPVESSIAAPRRGAVLSIEITPATRSYTFASTTVQVTVNWCADEALLSTSRAISLNGVSVTGAFTYQTYSSPQPCLDAGERRARSVGTVTLDEGVNVVVASICTVSLCATDSVQYTRAWAPVVAPPQSVRVTPDSSTVSVSAFAADTQRFWVRSLATSADSFDLALTCDRLAVSACALPGGGTAVRIGLAAGDSAAMDVAFTAGPVGAAGPLRLRAHRAADPHDQASGAVRVSVGAGAPGALRVRVAEAQAATAVAKDLCVSVAVTAEAAVACGDLRVVYPLRAIAVRNAVRQPVLLYDSRAASGTALLAAAVTLPAGATPTRVTATLAVRDTAGAWATATTGDWAGAPFTPGTAVRIALAWPMAAGGGSRLVPYRLDVTAWDGATPRAPVRDSGSFAFVDRRTSPLGAGWWVAGLEQLRAAGGGTPTPSDTALLWIGGDASARRFRSVAAQTWVAEAVDAPDTLRYRADSGFFERRLPGGLRVRFDTIGGRHVATVTRQGIQTRFAYDGAGRPSTIAPAGLSAPTHYFDYTADTVRICLLASCGSGARSRDVVHLSSGRTQAIAAVDTLPYQKLVDSTVVDTFRVVIDSVRFASDSLARITARWDRRGTKTAFAYVGRAGLLDTATTDSAGVAWRRLTFAHGQGAGLASPTAQVAAVPLLDVSTRLDGPRSDVGDTTRIWLDAFGAPRRIRDAAWRTTTLSRGDRTFPAPVTEQVAPNGATVWAMYDARGNLAVAAAVAPYGDTRVPATTYRWDAAWDAVTRVTRPAGDWTGARYETTTGNRLATFGMRGDTTHFTYVAAGPARGLVDTVRAPDGGVEAYGYDTLGNLAAVVAPDGGVTTIARDVRGRDSLRVLPIADTLTVRERRVYGARDRLDTLHRAGPARPYALRSAPGTTVAVPAESLTVRYTYDAEGNVTLVATEGYGDPQANQTESRSYDLAQRLLAQTAAGVTTRYAYDPAGNVVATLFPGEPVAVTARFDAANRLTQRITPAKVYAPSACAGFATGPLTQSPCQLQFPRFPNDGDSLRLPADTATFTYDTTGALATAVNTHADIRRRYYPGGALAGDSTRVAGTWTHLRVAYGWNGDRTLAALGADSLRYEYDSVGYLRRLWLPDDARLRFTWDLLGRQDSMIVHPDARAGAGAVTEHRTYDVASRLRTRRRATAVIGGLAFDSLSYDLGDRLTEVSHSTATGGAETITFHYTGLGALAAQEMTRGSAVAIEQFTTDAAGTVLASRRRDTAAPLDTAWYGQSFGANGALLGRGYASPPPSQWYVGRLYSDETEQATGTNGKVLRIGQVQERIVSGGGNPPTPDWSRQTALRQYFAADGRLAVVQREVWLTGGVRDGSFETYGYDALGRRVWTAARRDSGLCTAPYCDSYEERATWDGDALLREVRSHSGSSGPPYGTVTYLPGPAIDAPLGLWDGRLYTPGWRGGTFESSVWTDGTAADAAAGPGSSAEVAWSAARTVYFQPGPNDGGGAPRYTFVGSLATGGVQTTGQMYRRNRFYDPQTGQFTQPDPIGLAGGLNLYGYANGDPINFSDPFGLCRTTTAADGTVKECSDDSGSEAAAPEGLDQQGTTRQGFGALSNVGTPESPEYAGLYIAVPTAGPRPQVIAANVALDDKPGVVGLLRLELRGQGTVRARYVGTLSFDGKVWAATANIDNLRAVEFGRVRAVPQRPR